MNTTGKLITQDLNTIQILEMDKSHFPHPWTAGQWRELNPAHHKLFGWDLNSTLVGYALFGLIPGDDVAHLYKILILPAYRGKGESIKFWSHILDQLRELSISRVYLEVEASNLSAISFYKKTGFVTLKSTKAYYSNGEDALMMELTL